jgi:DNA-nicking Smr family endonuclease
LPAAPLDARAPAANGPDRRTSVRLRRGQIRPEARLDLHGLTQVEAHRALAAFIRGARAAGRRCVLVVTGKGSVATGGVLRREVPRWLELPELRGAILGVTAAHAKDGGSGALYVLLRRKVKG